jgi:hypothetical protein
MGPRGFARRGRRRGLVVGAAVGAAAARRNANNQSDDTAAGSDGDDQIAQLEKLAQLKKDGILTEEEFQAKKKQILGL